MLTIATWWIRKLGALTVIGLIATAINFAINLQAVIFLGVTVATVVFDLSSRTAGYGRSFKNPKSTMITAILVSMLSAAVAGTVIGSFFMAGPALAVAGGVAGWATLHAVGGLIGGTLGGVLVNMLIIRKAVNAVH